MYLERRRDHSLACDDSRQDSDYETGVEHPRWHGVEEGLGVGVWVRADVGCLANILYNQSGS